MAKLKYMKNDKVFIKFDISVLNMMIGFIFKKSTQVTRKSLNNMKRLFSIIDPSSYSGNPKLEARIKVIEKALEAKLDKGFESEELILNYCRTDLENDENAEILRSIPTYSKLNYEEIKFINKSIEDRLTYAYIMNYIEPFYNTLERANSGEFNSFGDIASDLKSICTEFINTSRKTRSLDDSESISLTDDDFEDNITEIVEDFKNPDSILYTGITKLNEILSPGLLSERLYCFMGLPAGFKSGTLLKIVRDIKKYNSGIEPRKPGKTPTVLLVTMENKVNETIERLFNMVATTDDIRKFTPKQVIRMLRKDGELVVTDNNNIDIVIKYRPNRSIDTSDLYTMISDLEDDGKDVIALVLDYLKRIRPAEYGKDEKEELKNITNELKTLAIDHKIPVITAHQLNRSGAATVDAAMQANKEDLGKLLGRGNVGSAWEIIENCDWICIINVEKKRDTGRYYLTFKRVKIRYKDLTDLGYFNHPFDEGGKIRLLDDVHLDKPLSEESLASDFDGIDVSSKGKRNAFEDEIVNGHTSEDVFEFDKAITNLDRDPSASIHLH